MLAEIRRLFAAGPEKDDAVRAMIARTKKIAGAVPPEGTFWLGMCQAREGNLEDALATMTVMDLRLGTDAQAVNGVLYNGDRAKRAEANDLFSALNESGDIG